MNPKPSAIALLSICVPGVADHVHAQPSPAKIKFEDGVDRIPDRATFKKLAYQGTKVVIDLHLKGVEFVKFQIEDVATDKPLLYFINTKTHRAHMRFTRAVGIPGWRPGSMRGVLAYRPLLRVPRSSPRAQELGLYTFEFEPNDIYPFEKIQFAFEQLQKFAPILRGRLAFHPLPLAIPRYRREQEAYEAADLPVLLSDDLFSDIGFLPLNLARGFGRLRLMRLDQRPSPRDIVLYKTLPNEMPRVAGIITAVRQTPLSHVNLRAVQDGVPNAFITNATKNTDILALLGKYVSYDVRPDGYSLREATTAEVDAHFAGLRPKEPQTPPRDLSVKQVRPLESIGFQDSSSVGVKAANLATLRKIGLPESVVPSGFAVPFFFYDTFMRSNGLYAKARAMRETAGFRDDAELREKMLDAMRKDIVEGEMPTSLRESLREIQKTFTSPIRCRSSTNNEDLPGFSGAGLYDSFTHNPREGHLEKSIKQVYASLWNFRAYEEREFYRVDHFATAMGVLCHPNFANEQSNGVAVTDDIAYQTGWKYYISTQIGDDLVTNPSEHSVPEELLMSPVSAKIVTLVRASNRVPPGKRVLDGDQLRNLRKHLGRIHREFGKLYRTTRPKGRFAMEIEFKITSSGDLVIKQARPWVYSR